MSELKVVKQSDVLCGHWSTEYYLKSEADKVIAEKDAEIARLKAIRKVHVEAIESMGAGLLQDDNEIQHLKYKRCLAMASRCFTKSNYHFVLARHGEDGKENNRKSILYSKWRKRWLAIAEKFKEEK